MKANPADQASATKPQPFLAACQAALMAALPIAPTIAALVTVAAYLTAQPGQPGEPDRSLLYAAINFFGTWALLALLWHVLGYTRSDRINPGSYRQLSALVDDLEAQAQLLAHPMGGQRADEPIAETVLMRRLLGATQTSALLVDMEAQQQAIGWHGVSRTDIVPLMGAVMQTHLAAVRERLDGCASPGWVLGSDYVFLWERVHRAEEALILLEPRERLAEHAGYELARCTGSGICGEAEAAKRLEGVIAYLAEPPASERTQGEAQCDDRFVPRDETSARAVVSCVRRAINELRDDAWAGLVRARNCLGMTTALTGFTVYLLLWLALMGGASSGLSGTAIQRMIAALTGFYLIGVVVGFFQQLYLNAHGSTSKFDNDFGLTAARLIAVPLLSGVAAVGGVALTAITAMTHTGTSGADATMMVGYLQFDHVLNIIIAAAFGLTPSLLIGQLERHVNDLTTNLQKTSATGQAAGAQPATDTTPTGKAALATTGAKG